MDDRGDLYVADFVNRRIVKFSAESARVEVVAGGVAAHHVAIGRGGTLYARCDRGLIRAFAGGRCIGTLRVPSDVPLIEGYEQSIRVVTERVDAREVDAIYVNDRTHHWYRVGRATGAGDAFEIRRDDRAEKLAGLPERDGVRYLPRWKSRRLGLVLRKVAGTAPKATAPFDDPNAPDAAAPFDEPNAEDATAPFDEADAPKAATPIRLPIDRGSLGGMCIKGMLDDGDLVLENERIGPDGYVHLEIHRHDRGTGRWSVLEVPNDYFVPVYRKTCLGPDGAVYQMTTSPRGVRFLKWPLSYPLSSPAGGRD